MGHPSYQISRISYGARMSSAEFYDTMNAHDGNNDSHIRTAARTVVQRQRWSTAQREALRDHFARLVREGIITPRDTTMHRLLSAINETAAHGAAGQLTRGQPTEAIESHPQEIMRYPMEREMQHDDADEGNESEAESESDETLRLIEVSAALRDHLAPLTREEVTTPRDAAMHRLLSAMNETAAHGVADQLTRRQPTEALEDHHQENMRYLMEREMQRDDADEDHESEAESESDETLRLIEVSAALRNHLAPLAREEVTTPRDAAMHRLLSAINETAAHRAADQLARGQPTEAIEGHHREIMRYLMEQEIWNHGTEVNESETESESEELPRLIEVSASTSESDSEETAATNSTSESMPPLVPIELAVDSEDGTTTEDDDEPSETATTTQRSTWTPLVVDYDPYLGPDNTVNVHSENPTLVEDMVERPSITTIGAATGISDYNNSSDAAITLSTDATHDAWAATMTYQTPTSSVPHHMPPVLSNESMYGLADAAAHREITPGLIVLTDVYSGWTVTLQHGQVTISRSAHGDAESIESEESQDDAKSQEHEAADADY